MDSATCLALSPKIDTKYWGPRLARNVLRNSLRLKEGENVTIEAWPRALPWIDYFLMEARSIGAHPMVIYDSDNAFWSAVERGLEKNLGELGEQEWAALRASNAYVYFWGPADRARWYKLGNAKLKTITSYQDKWYEISKSAAMRWCRIEVARVTEKLAKEYGISYSRWVEELLEASVLNPDQMVRDGRKIADKLDRGGDILISHRNGTNLRVRVKQGKRAYVDDGVVDENDVRLGVGELNIPSGIVLAPLEETYAEGTFVANRATRFGPARGSSAGGRWTFKDGKLSKYSYAKGQKNFEKLYEKGEVEFRDKPGIISIGLNPKIRDSPLFEDQELGVITLNIGTNDWLGGSNTGDYRSWLHLRGADLNVNGEAILKGGRLSA